MFWLQNILEGDRREVSRSLGSTFTEDTLGNLVTKTPQGAVIAATTY
jgi:hypothetical protein